MSETETSEELLEQRLSDAELGEDEFDRQIAQNIARIERRLAHHSIELMKTKRYSGMFGWLRKRRDARGPPSVPAYLDKHTNYDTLAFRLAEAIMDEDDYEEPVEQLRDIYQHAMMREVNLWEGSIKAQALSYVTHEGFRKALEICIARRLEYHDAQMRATQTPELRQQIPEVLKELDGLRKIAQDNGMQWTGDYENTLQAYRDETN